MRKVLLALGSGLRLLWIWLGLSLVLLLSINAALDALLSNPPGLAPIDPSAQAPARESADAFADPTWAQAYFEEFEQARHTVWRSYVYFRRLPFAGKFIHVDEHGFRSTPTSGEAAAPALQVWLFGGSLVWGTGVDDQHTLAAVLQRQLAQALGRPVRVSNFGESGYVSQQSLLAFASALRCDGPAPDLALFVDGVNDVFSALQSGRAGLPQNENNRVVEFNLSRRIDRVLLAWASRLKGVGKLLRRAPPVIDSAALGAEVARSYLATAGQMLALGQARGVPVRLFWQPSLFDKPTRSVDEQAAYGASLQAHMALQQRATATLRQLATGELGLIDLSDTFSTEPAARYFDFVHMNAAGIEQLAAGMLPAAVQALSALETAPVAETSEPGCVERPVPQKP